MKRFSKHPGRAAGFSLVEMMVAITLGAIILAAVSAVLVTSKKSYTTQDRLGRLQENARFAMQFITRDLRAAGYYGCHDDIASVNSTLNVPAGGQFDTNISIEGYDPSSSATTWYPAGAGGTTSSGKPSPDMIAGTDAVAIRMLETTNTLTLTGDMPRPSAELDVDSVGDLQPNDIVMISDCSSADIMQVTQVQEDSLKIQHNPGEGTPGNKNGKDGWLNKSYSPPATVSKYVNRVYYVKDDGANPPVLCRNVIGGGSEEPLVEGIENLQILYGVDSDGDGVPNRYLEAGATGLQTAAEWLTVKSVRIGIVARTLREEGDTLDKDFRTFDLFGNTVGGAGDRHKRRVFQSTVLLRNL